MRDIRDASRKPYAAAEESHIIVRGLRGEAVFAGPGDSKGLAGNHCHIRSKAVLGAGNRRGKVEELRRQARELTQAVAGCACSTIVDEQLAAAR